MSADVIAVGSVVRLATHRCTASERDARYVVVEINGDRLFARLICDLRIPPVELLSLTDVREVNS